MRKNFIAAMASLALGAAFVLTVSSSAQTEVTGGRIYGYKDAKSGVFVPQIHGIEPDATVTPIGGTVQVTITTTLKSVVPTGAKVYCGTELFVTATTLTTGATGIWTESSASVATVVGTTATCIVTTPYAYPVPPASATQMNTLSGQYFVAIVPTTPVFVGAGSNIRSTSGPVVSQLKLPATGTVTKYVLAATL